ncbi:SDR family NAD(P)-dependent oxidoreductase [Nocardiopsis alba]|uniref:SDR family NAD(P)-dependent oxidoreductase n=1 Tax=Nocardiopsis alba TaxID=53437 RepID=UPI0033B0C1CA
MELDLSGKKTLVTGGTRGIGKGIVLALARAGADVVTCYRGDEEAAELTRAELAETGGKHLVLQADVTDAEDVANLVARAREHHGALDTVICNAGTISHIPYRELPVDEWTRVIDTNLTAVHRVIQSSLDALAPEASIVVVGSRAAAAGVPLRAHYTAAKAGLSGLVRSLAKELGPEQIRVNLVSPGIIRTEEFAKLPKEKADAMQERYGRLTALGRLGEPRDVGGPVLFLASDLSRYITGETLIVSGGI